MVPANAPPGNCFNCGGPGHWASMCPVKGPRARMQMVGHRVSQKGVAFDMQGPPPSACRWCGGNHWEQFCPAAQQQQAQMGQGQQGMAPGQGFMGNQETVNMAMGQQIWGQHMINAGHQPMANPMQAQAAQGVGGGPTSDHISKQCLQAVYRELGI